MSNLNLGQMAQKVQNVFERPQAAPQGQAPLPQTAPIGTQSTQRNTFPPAPQLRTQQKPTQIAMSDFKYNAFNIDKISLNITSQGGFNGVTPDMMIWNTYEYHVTDFKASADEVELSNYVNWALQDKGIQDTKIDFHDNQKVTLSGKYPLLGIPLPFEAEFQVETTAQNKILLTVDNFKTGFAVPKRLQNALLNLFVGDNQPPAGQSSPLMNPMSAFDLTAAMRKVGENQIEIDFSKMPVSLDLPISKILTNRYGVEIVGGTQQLTRTP